MRSSPDHTETEDVQIQPMPDITQLTDFDRAMACLIDDQSPRGFASRLSTEECEMLLMAQRIRGTKVVSPDPSFVECLHDDLFGHAPGVSRRTAVMMGFGSLAAGILAAVGLHEMADSIGSGTTPVSSLVGANGKWFRVADLAIAHERGVLPFAAGAIQGVLLSDHGELKAVSRICTHMACRLTISREAGELQCPCHGARFTLAGRYLMPPGGSQHRLPDLPILRVRVIDRSVEVLGV
jgi:cytochrome b6-f complex iron-sulfur subunit